jgi:hypothetical protein
MLKKNKECSMLNTYKKCLVMILFVLLSLGVTNGFAFAYSEVITLEAREDAGLYPKENAYIGFEVTTSDGPTSSSVTTTEISQFTNSDEVYAYAGSHFSIGSTWVLQSAGNAWSSTDKIVGESLENLQAGTYRITPADGAYRYDAFGWTPDCSNKYWWELHIKVQDGSSEFDYMLGSKDSQTMATSAFNAVKDQFKDITLTEGGSLSFWIFDGNSIDNDGSLTFNVTSVPEPSTSLLLTLGLALLMWRIRNRTIK